MKKTIPPQKKTNRPTLYPWKNCLVEKKGGGSTTQTFKLLDPFWGFFVSKTVWTLQFRHVFVVLKSTGSPSDICRDGCLSIHPSRRASIRRSAMGPVTLTSNFSNSWCLGGSDLLSDRLYKHHMKNDGLNGDCMVYTIHIKHVLMVDFFDEVN